MRALTSSHDHAHEHDLDGSEREDKRRRRTGRAARGAAPGEQSTPAGFDASAAPAAFAQAVNAGVHDTTLAAPAAATSGGSSDGMVPAALRASAESTFGADLSHVRIHTDAAAAAKAEAVGARAYALGSDIYFGAGEFAPDTTEGQHLIAHELAHTVQQSGRAAAPQRKQLIGEASDSLEHEADRAADAVIARSGPVQLSRAGSALVQRTPGAATSRMPATRAAVESAIRGVGRIEELDRVIAVLETMPADTDGIQEIEIGGTGYGVRYEWAQALYVVATTRRGELAAAVSPPPETTRDAAATAAISGAAETTFAGEGADVSLGLDVGARVRIPFEVGELEIGIVEALRTDGSVHGRPRVRYTEDRRPEDRRRGGPERGAEPELRGSISTPAAEVGGGDAGALHFDPIGVSGRATGGLAVRSGTRGTSEVTTAGVGFQLHFAGTYRETPFAFDINVDLLSIEAEPGRFRIREPSVELLIPLPGGVQVSVRFTPNIEYLAPAAFAIMQRLSASGTALATRAGVIGESATAETVAARTVGTGAEAVGVGTAEGIAAEGVAVTGVGAIVGGLIIVDFIHSALEAVWEGQRMQARELDGAIAAGNAIGVEMETLLRDLCAGYAAVMRGDAPPGSTGGELGASQARARIESLLASMPLDDIHANARATPNLYAQVYALAAPQFRREAELRAREIGAQTTQPESARVMALHGMIEHITAAATPGASTPPVGWHPPML